MPAEATGIGVPAAGPALLPYRVALVLDTLTIPGRPEHVAQARRFVAATVGRDHPQADVAMLLTSEIVTNAIVHSRSALPGGIVTIDIAEIPGGLLVVVTDNGSPVNTPAVKDPTTAAGENGNGLVLVGSLSEAWGYREFDDRMAVWFTLATDHGQPPRASPAAASTRGPESPRSRTPHAADVQ